MDKIKWGIIGTGKIAHKFAEALKGCADAELYAVASRTLEKAQDFAAEYGFAESYGSYKELAENTEADVVYIATPMSCHYADSMLCLNCGKHVLCEKSVTLNSRQIDTIFQTARYKGLFFMEAMWMKCRPTYLKAREWVNQGRIGEITYIKADFSNDIPWDSNDRLFRPDCGGGSLLDLTMYPITIAHDFLGNPDEIISSALIRDGIDLSENIVFRYNNGANAYLFGGFEYKLRNNAIISGTDGFITFGDYFHCTDEVKLFDRDGKIIEDLRFPDRINGYEYEIEEVHRCLRENLSESPLVPHNTTADVMKIMDTCRKQWGLVFPGE